MQVAAFRQKQNPQIQPRPELKIFSERTQADAGMKMRTPKGRFHAGDGRLHRRLLLRRERLLGAVKFRAGENHGFQGLSRPA